MEIQTKAKAISKKCSILKEEKVANLLHIRTF